MQQTMEVVEHVTNEKSEVDVKFKVILEPVMIKGSNLEKIISRVTLVSTTDALFKEFPLQEQVSVKIEKPQRKL